MSEQFYSDARLYDRLFLGGEPAVDFYRAEADRQAGLVLELGCGTEHMLIPIASNWHRCLGLQLSPDMLAEAEGKADDRGVEVEWLQGDMREFDLAEEKATTQRDRCPGVVIERDEGAVGETRQQLINSLV